ncbi:unnamed protein product [Rotaria sp. Silwood2]|nr:unnamed protein product [Rotaria sp. Silwood2]
MFNQWLTKRFTLANFGCEDEEIRKSMITYDLNDCLAVTKLVYEVPSATETESPTPLITNDLEAISDDELALDHEQEPVGKWPVNELIII